MNVALPALIVFLLLLPGFIARSRFKRAERISLDYSPFGQIVTEAMLWNCVFHPLWLLGAAVLFGHVLQPLLLLELLSSDPASQARAIQGIARQFSWICAYFLSLYAGAWVVPNCFRLAITRFRLDRSGAGWFVPWLRFNQAPWYYLLTGADFDQDQQPDLIAVSAIVNVAGQAVLFTGILDDFFVDASGSLDRLILSQVMRRPLVADKEDSSTVADDLARFYGVDGDYFVLRYSEAITLNIEYIKVDMDVADIPATAAAAST
ncbi:hypothetical protein SAMN04515618_106196 [Collimonas sp. OK307]|uniref:hypothetical protein n=1 Tax=Collimonas sp. OK307 TaxID=1801620 RepID=UPI0008E2740A|nr:hypothetical protein [Collimonas sp. OK307]SFH96098.1 hypothetical protein SAMN04515618_106196 [Collimonas sp. OK307]